MWGPPKPQGTYDEVTQRLYKGRKRRFRAKAEGTLTFEGPREKEEPMYEAKDRGRWPKASKRWERDWAGG